MIARCHRERNGGAGQWITDTLVERIPHGFDFCSCEVRPALSGHHVPGTDHQCRLQVKNTGHGSVHRCLVPGGPVRAIHIRDHYHTQCFPGIRKYREQHEGIYVLAHPECPPEVLAEADYVGSTSGMIKHVKEVRPNRVIMITECSMSDNVASELPDIEFTRPCNLCPHMKRITLEGIRDSLLRMQHEIHVHPSVAVDAWRAVERMLAVQ